MQSGPPADTVPPAHTSARPFLIGCCILLAVLEAFGTLYTNNPTRWTDFRVYYTAGYMVRTHPSTLYDFSQQLQLLNTFNPAPHSHSLFIHPSYEALLFAAFSFLPYRAAYLAYLAFGVVLIAATFFVARPLFSARIPWLQARPGLMLLLYVPVAGSIFWGQDSIIFLFLCSLTWRQLERGQNLSAGCILALALFRFQLAIPIAILTAVRRGWRFSAGFLAASTAVAALCFALVGRAGMTSLYQMLTAAALVKDQTFQTQLALGIHPLGMPNLVGILYAAGTRHLTPPAATLVIVATSLAVFFWTLSRVRREPEDTIAFAMAILCAVLISYHFYAYDLTLTVLPMALAARRLHAIALLALTVAPIVPPLLLGLRWFFVLGIPLFALLAYLGTSRRHKTGSSANASPATPLYTQLKA